MELTNYVCILIKQVLELTNYVSILTKQVLELTNYVNILTKQVLELTNYNARIKRSWKNCIQPHNDSCWLPALGLKLRF